MQRVHRLLAVLGAGSVLVVSACSSTGSITLSRPTATTTSTTDAPSAAPVATLASLRSASEASATATSGRFEYRITGAGAEELVSVSGEFSDSRAHEVAAVSGLDAEVGGGHETVVDGDDVYVRGGMVAAILGLVDGGEANPEQWIRISGSVGEIVGDLNRSVTGEDGFREEVAHLLDDTDAAVTTVGPEDVRGIPTTHSRVGTDFPIDLWVDGDGRLVRARYAFDAGGESVVLSFELWDLGAPIEIAVPTDARDVDLPGFN